MKYPIEYYRFRLKILRKEYAALTEDQRNGRLGKYMKMDIEKNESDLRWLLKPIRS